MSVLWGILPMHAGDADGDVALARVDGPASGHACAHRAGRREREAVKGSVAGGRRRGTGGEGGGAVEGASDAAVIRVALFVPTLAGGGITTVMLALAGGLARRGMAVDVVVLNRSGERTTWVPAGVRLVDLVTRRLVAAPWALARYVGRERPDLLVAASWYAVLPALVSKRFLRRRVRTWVRQDSTFSMHIAHARLKHRAVLKLIERLLPAADRVVAVSEGVARDLERRVPGIADRLAVVANPAVHDGIAQMAAMPVEHPWLGDPDVPVILGAGRLVHAKDFATLIGAFAELRRSVPARLIILGSGPEEEALRALARELGVADAVDLPGFVANPYAWMSKARVLAVSSVYEGLSTVLLEAMACGTPVVSTDCPHGPGEVLEGGRLGPLVAVGDAGALAGAIAQAMESPVAPEILVAKAHAFSVERSVDRHVELLMEDMARESEP